MGRCIKVLAWGLLLLGFPAAGKVAADRPVVFRARLENQAISPATARYVDRAIQEAERQRAECLVLVLDTPGGLVDSTRVIVRRVLGSEVPVLVYVAPPGARAASAGVFIVLAGHVAAMAPGTNIGAAHPVQIGGLPSSPARPGREQQDDPSDRVKTDKVVNDTVAWARSLAELRGRNADWAARAVKESLSVSSTEAVQERVVDVQASNLDELLRAVHGREVTVGGARARLRTAGAEVRDLEMWWGEQLLAVLTNPNVAFLLLMFGFYGVLFELNTPGWGVSGTLGVVCLLLALSGLAALPVNYVGLALVGVALALFVAEAFVTSYGALSVAGVVTLVLGGTMLVDSPIGFQRVSLDVVVPVALATAVITVFLVGSVVKAHRGRVQTGAEGLTGGRALAETDFLPRGDRYTGTVRARGETWNATSGQPVAAGEAVEIQGREGLTLLVGPAAALAATETQTTTERRGGN